jgi:hypothetical protein
MVGRLGNVLYWLGCIVAGLALLWGFGNFAVLISGSSMPGENGDQIIKSVAVAIAAWLVGRAIRYVLAST